MNKAAANAQYDNNPAVLKPDYIQFNENSVKIELEGFSNKNSEAKYKKNLQFRKKLPKKCEREHSTPSRLNMKDEKTKPETTGLISNTSNTLDKNLNEETIMIQEHESVDQYKSFLNNSNSLMDSLYKEESDDLFLSSLGSKEIKIVPAAQKPIIRSNSISSSNISLHSEDTSSRELIGWSYQKTREGKLHNMTKDYEWRQLYKSRYINERVEVELIEFKDEIEK